MGKQHDHRLLTYLPAVLVATLLVTVVPVLLVLRLRTSGAVESAWVGMLIGVATSFLASSLGGALWKTRSHSRDILFSDLMLWGWVQRWRNERRLVAASDLLGLTPGRPRAVAGKRLTDEEKIAALTRLTAGLEARDPYTYGHSRRVARHAAATARKMGLSRAEVAKVRAAGAIHDVGKLRTPIALLGKSGKLTDEEYAVIKRHPGDGAEMAGALDDPSLAAMVRHHHERLDGTGYPDGLRGDAVPIGARILAVADTFDAITSTRPYRHARSHRAALNVLSAEAGTQLDPDAVRAFCSCYSGRRPLVYWTMLVHARPRLTAMLGGGLGPAQANSMANVVATATAVATVGVGAVALDVGSQDPRASASADVVVPAEAVASPSPVGPAAWKAAAAAVSAPAAAAASTSSAAASGPPAARAAGRPAAGTKASKRRGVRPAKKARAPKADPPAATTSTEPVAAAPTAPKKKAARAPKSKGKSKAKRPPVAPVPKVEPEPASKQEPAEEPPDEKRAKPVEEAEDPPKAAKDPGDDDDGDDDG